MAVTERVFFVFFGLFFGGGEAAIEFVLLWLINEKSRAMTTVNNRYLLRVCSWLFVEGFA